MRALEEVSVTDRFEALRDHALGVELQLIEVRHRLDEASEPADERRRAALADEWNRLMAELAEVADQLADAA